MKKYVKLQANTKDRLLKISILKSMMYCGVLWGLYNPEQQGWAIKTDQSDYIFPFWLSSLQAIQYAKIHWPSYVPRKITPQDFEDSLLPTLTRFKVIPTLFNHKSSKFKLSTAQMRHFFFNQEHAILTI